MAQRRNQAYNRQWQEWERENEQNQEESFPEDQQDLGTFTMEVGPGQSQGDI